MKTYYCPVLARIKIAANKKPIIHPEDTVTGTCGMSYPAQVHSLYWNGKNQMLRHKHQYGNYLVEDFAFRFTITP